MKTFLILTAIYLVIIALLFATRGQIAIIFGMLMIVLITRFWWAWLIIFAILLYFSLSTYRRDRVSKAEFRKRQAENLASWSDRMDALKLTAREERGLRGDDSTT